jgi:Co/Zn/Cd efflux system component
VDESKRNTAANLASGMPGGGTTRTIFVALGAGIGVSVAKVAAAVVTSSPAMAAEAAHSLGDTANDLFLVVAQHRSARPPNKELCLATVGKPTSGPQIAALGYSSPLPHSRRAKG